MPDNLGSAEEIKLDSTSEVMQNLIAPYLHNPAQLFSTLHEFRYKKGLKNNLAEESLALFHNQKSADIFELAASAIRNLDGGSVFRILNLVELSIPYLENIRTEVLFTFFKIIYPSIKDDLAGGRINSALAKWLSVHIEQSKEIIKIYTSDAKEDCSNLYFSALNGMLDGDFDEGFAVVIKAAKATVLLEAAPALNALGNINYIDKQKDAAFDVAFKLTEGLIKNPNSPVFFSACMALTALVSKKLERYQALIIMGQGGNKEALFALSKFLISNLSQCGNELWFNDLLLMCAVTKASHQGTLDDLDLVLMSFCENPNKHGEVINFLTKWIEAQTLEEIKDKGVADVFDNTVRSIVSHPNIVSKIITEWLVHDNFNFCLSAEKIISSLSVYGEGEIAFDVDCLDNMDAKSLLLLARRTMGFVHKNTTAFQLIWSMVNTKDAQNRVYEIINSTFGECLGYEYGESAKTFLQEKIDKQSISEPLKVLCLQIISIIDRYFADIDGLQKLNEAIPPYTKRVSIAKYQHKQQRNMQKEVRERSIVAKLATHISLKAGTGSFSYRGSNYTEISKMSSYGYSIDLPRSEAIDPVGASYKRLKFRTSTKGE